MTFEEARGKVIGPASSCPKCRAIGVGRSFIEQYVPMREICRSLSGSNSNGRARQMFPDMEVEVVPEHMVWSCATCGYSFKSLCADAKGGKEDALKERALESAKEAT